MRSLLALPKGDRSIASSRHRVYGLLEELCERGWSTSTLMPSMSTGPRALALPTDLARAARPHDVLLVQRPGRRREERLVLALASSRSRLLVLDVDDPVDDAGVFGWALARADVLLAGSRAVLDRYGPRVRHALLVPTPLSIGRYAMVPPVLRSGAPVAGFIGDVAGYEVSLTRMLGRLTPPFVARVVGTRGDAELEKRLRAACPVPIETVAGIEWESEDAVARAIADFDLGLAPFRDAEGGSYKTVQYLASGVVPLVEAGGEAEWHVRAALGAAAPVVALDGPLTPVLARLADAAVRTEMAEQGRKAAERFDRARVAADVDALLRSVLDWS